MTILTRACTTLVAHGVAIIVEAFGICFSQALETSKRDSTYAAKKLRSKAIDFLVILNLIGKHIQSFITVGPANRAFLNSLIFRIAVGVENERRRTQASPLEILEVPGRCYAVIRSRFWKGHHASSIAKSTAR